MAVVYALLRPCIPLEDTRLFIRASMYARMAQPDTQTARKRKRKSTHSFCQDLALSLAKADRRPPSAYYTNRIKHNNSKSPFLRLPTEVRQQILLHTLHDREMVHQTKINRHTRTLLRVCKTIRDDMPFVIRAWRELNKILLAERQKERDAFESLIADLLAPVAATSAVVSQFKRPRQRHLSVQISGNLTSTVLSPAQQQMFGQPPRRRPYSTYTSEHSREGNNTPSFDRRASGTTWVERRWEQQSAAVKEDAEEWRRKSVRKRMALVEFEGEDMNVMALQKAYKRNGYERRRASKRRRNNPST